MRALTDTLVPIMRQDDGVWNEHPDTRKVCVSKSPASVPANALSPANITSNYGGELRGK